MKTPVYTWLPYLLVNNPKDLPFGKSLGQKKKGEVYFPFLGFLAVVSPSVCLHVVETLKSSFPNLESYFDTYALPNLPRLE